MARLGQRRTTACSREKLTTNIERAYPYDAARAGAVQIEPVTADGDQLARQSGDAPIGLFLDRFVATSHGGECVSPDDTPCHGCTQTLLRAVVRVWWALGLECRHANQPKP
jgi:hypothetical protein